MSMPLSLQDAIALHQRGDLAGARAAYEAILVREPSHFDALHLLGVLSLQIGDAATAVSLISRALSENPPRPAHADANVNLGSALKTLARVDEALAAYERATLLNPRHGDAHYNRANLLRTRGDFAGARASFEAALTLRPGDAQTAFGLGLVLGALNDFPAAIQALEIARAGGIDAPELHEQLALAYGRTGRHEDAIARYTALIAANPRDAAAFSNRAVLLADLGRTADAFADFDRAIALKPDFAAAYLNRGVARRVGGDLDGAVADFTQAAALSPTAKTLYTLGTTLAEQSRHAEASEAYARAFALEPEHPFLLGTWLHVRMMLCDWRDFAPDVAKLERMIARGQKAIPVLPLTAISDDLALQKKTAEVWTADRVGTPVATLPTPQVGSKIRIGYFSADFRMHPVAQLAAGLFESHDRAQFETFAFSLGPNTGDAMRKRLEGAFDRFIDIRAMSDADVISRARAFNLDVAVDLTGYTGGSRPAIFAGRVAPVQVSYLGYPATMGAAFIDYLVADAALVPKTARPFYSEKIITLPSFQVNDRAGAIDAGGFSREDMGLPPRGFVFACLNNAFKITPDVFERWMRILARAPESVLFLVAEGMAAENLKREAERRGVDPARVIVGKKVPTTEYWARLRAADLFLDTAPFNAHSTASDALWAGLPVLTCPGQAYAARVAASLLTALDMRELIAPTWVDYEMLAVALATDPPRLAAIREKLARQCQTSRLFDTVRFTRTLEAAYTEIVRRARAGQPPDHIDIVLE